MVSGTIVIEDSILTFTDIGENRVTYTVFDAIEQAQETLTVYTSDFFRALAIAVHPDGADSYEENYALAEAVMPNNPELRWIP